MTDKYRHRITAENCVRGKEELITNFYHRVKQAVYKGWPIDAAANQNERDAQQNLRNQKYIDFTIRGLTPSGLQTEFVPNSTNDQNSKLDSLEKQVRELSTVLKEQHVNAVNQANTRTNDKNNKSRQRHTLVTTADETGILYNIAEPKPLMTYENVNTIARISRKSQLSPTTITRERDQISDHKTTTTPILNPTPTLHKGMVTTIVSV